jgi:flagellar basal body-associated protein FliL
VGIILSSIVVVVVSIVTAMMMMMMMISKKTYTQKGLDSVAEEAVEADSLLAG